MSVPSPDHHARFRRLRNVSWLLDRSIPIGRWRIGLDPILGLLPGAGDWLGALLSLYVVYEGARLGTPAGVLARMVGNILVETIIGAVPVLGDLFDFVWQANQRNLVLIERHYRPERKGASLLHVTLFILALATAVSAVVAGGIYLLFKMLSRV